MDFKIKAYMKLSAWHVDGAILRYDLPVHSEVVPQTGCKIVLVMGWGEFDGSRALGHVRCHWVGNHLGIKNTGCQLV